MAQRPIISPPAFILVAGWSGIELEPYSWLNASIEG